MRYRRADVQGASYFFTVNIADRRKTLLVDHIDLLRAVTKKIKHDHPFQIDVIVVMPDHLHTIWTLPKNDANFSTRWSLIKAGFSRQLPKLELISSSRKTKSERGIWQRRFWEHLIRDETDFEQHVDYIHNNPVKHGYVKKPIDWPYSSIHQYVKNNILSADWAAVDTNGSYGE